MTPFADLHIHTHFSDSTSSPEEVVRDALACGLKCISITDHDTLDGVVPTRNAAQAHGLEVMTGIELSSDIDGKDIHVLGYFFSDVGEVLVDQLEKMQTARVERIKEMILKLEGIGLKNITLEEVMELTKSRAVGRMHMATVLRQKGYVTSIPEAFQRFIGDGCPGYAAKYKISTFDVIRMIKKANGLAVLAHPLITGRDELIPRFVEAGLDGLEVYYPRHSSSAIIYYEKLAEKHQLLRTGGSDAHGQAKQDTFVGRSKIPYELVLRLKERAAKMRARDE